MEPELIDDDDLYEFDEFSEFDEDDDDDFYDFDDFSEYDDDDDLYDEDDEDDDDDFAMEGDDIERRSRRSRRRARRRARRARRRGVKTGKGRGYMQRQLKGYVKRTELRKSLARVGRDVKRNAAGIKTNARRLSSTNSRVSSTQRVNRAQSKEIAKIKADIAQQQQMQFLMTLIDRGPKTYAVTGDTTNTDGGRVLSLDEQEDALTTLLPFLMGGSSMGGSSDGGMFGNPLMLLALTGAFK
ncbi:MAG: hypothetical protein ACSHW1_11585 [Yoonia sp.]|uniref:hypothetical protein n=1 Tax=Yoonia sp. TaxID=2212373 RepID=UPI003EF8B2A0